MISAQIFRFLLIGAASAITQLTVLAMFLNFFACALNFSVTTAYVASVVVHFLGNKYFTFNSIHDGGFGEVARYLVVVLLNYLITICVVWFVVEVHGGTPYMATIFSISATVGIGFVLSKTWVFKKSE